MSPGWRGTQDKKFIKLLIHLNRLFVCLTFQRFLLGKPKRLSNKRAKSLKNVQDQNTTPPHSG